MRRGADTRLAAMPGIRASLAPIAVSLVAALGACGEDTEGTIPADAGEQMIAQLDAIEERVQAGECESATGAAQDLVQQVQALPAEEVDAEVRNALLKAGDTLVAQTQDPDQCREEEPDTTTSTTESSTSTTEPTSTTESTTEDTTTEKSTTEDTTTTETETETTETTTGSTTTDDDSGGIGSDG